MLTCWHLVLSTMQVPMPSVVTTHDQQSDGHFIVRHGSVSQVFVCDTHAFPGPHTVPWHLSSSHLPVVGLQNCLSSQGTFQHGSAMQLPATQRCPSPHLPGTHRSLQVPLSQYRPVPQFLPRHGSVWHLPATQICGAVQASDGSLQSMQRGVRPEATHCWGGWQTTPEQT